MDVVYNISKKINSKAMPLKSFWPGNHHLLCRWSFTYYPLIHGETMKLSAILKKCEDLTCSSLSNPEITMICSDSRQVTPGALFIAIQGYQDNGIKYIENAVSRGAEAVIIDEKYRSQLGYQNRFPVCYTDHPRKCALNVSRIFYNNPSKAFILSGITGTNGKTTVTYLIEEILRENRQNPGVIGTISYRYNDIIKKAKNTTPDPIDIQFLFNEMKKGGVSHVIMEVSSHALVMDRIQPQDFDLGIFTNLSQDHLDFHETMEEYFKAKAQLFMGLKEDAYAVINNDDSYGKKIMSITRANVLTYGINTRSDYTGKINSLSIEGSTFLVNGTEFKINLAGEHNIYNVLSAYAAVKVFNIDDDTIGSALLKIKNIPGRFERVKEGDNYHVFVDYAHTPDALDHLLDAANSLKRGRIITVFGCGGDRDRGKRPIMGGIVEKKSDIAIVTSDNPRTEDPLAIIEDIKKGLNGDNHLVIPDRKEAIYRAIELARKDDIVLIAGKGHEDYQILKEKTINFNDREIALEAIKSIKK